jgi:2-polyprenyl-3-methyl-5-hydroxy-6-metoxy-1,4-benzoquinol methylase
MTAPPLAEVPVLQNLVDTVSTARVLQTSAELGLIDRLATGPRDATALAAACSIDPSMTQLLLDALAGLGVTRREAEGRYELAVDGLSLLAAVDRGWSQLPDVMRTGDPVVPVHTADGAETFYPDIVPSLSALVAPATRRAARLLTGSGVDVLDVGAGAAPWSIPLARHSAGVRVTALDLPAVIAATRRAVDTAGLGDRFDYLAGDMFACALPAAAYDVVLLANVCHLFGAAQNTTLLRRLRPALRPGGLLAIIDVLAPAEAAAPLSVSLYSLGLRLRTPDGAVHSLAAYEGWTRGAGFGPIQLETLSSTPSLCLLAARRR